MTASLRRFIDWVAAYTLSPTGAVLRMAMSAPSALEAPGYRAGWRLGVAEGQRVTPERARVLAALADGFANGRKVFQIHIHASHSAKEIKRTVSPWAIV
jgi:primosomal protein N' (replication factor Y)